MEQRDSEYEGSWSWHQGQWNVPPPPSLPTVLSSHHLHEGNELWLDTSACGSGKDSQECSPRRKKSQKGYLDCFKKILLLLLCSVRAEGESPCGPFSPMVLFLTRAPLGLCFWPRCSSTAGWSPTLQRSLLSMQPPSRDISDKQLGNYALAVQAGQRGGDPTLKERGLTVVAPPTAIISP